MFIAISIQKRYNIPIGRIGVCLQFYKNVFCFFLILEMFLGGARPKNKGWRLDYFIISPQLLEHVVNKTAFLRDFLRLI